MAERKKRIMWHSDPATNPTGFGAWTKYILTHLYKSGRFEIANYACGYASNSQEHLRFPWKTYASIPIERQDIVQRANQDQGFGRMLQYGEPLLDEAVKDFKPDIFITSNDFWGGPSFAVDKCFWDKINCVAFWTADSLPLLDDAVEKAVKIKNHYVTAQFAENEFHRIADELEKELVKVTDDNQKKQLQNRVDSWRRVKTIPGIVNEKSFYRLSEQERLDLRKKHGIDSDTFLIGTGSRSQLRKMFGQQIEAFSIFKKNFPEVKTKLLHWTGLEEGWNLQKHCKEFGVDINDVLCAHRCRKTGEIFLLPVIPGEKDNPKTGDKNSVKSVMLDNHAPEYEINNFLNLLDVFMLHINSGGFELFLSQAKLTEIPTIANSYSCFWEQVSPEKGTLETEQGFMYECGTNFKKAAPIPYSIYKNLKKVYEMDKNKRREIGRAGREFVLKNYSIEVVTKQWEKLIDSMPLYSGDWSFFDAALPNNPNAIVPNEESAEKWIHSLYQLILCREPDHEGFEYWKNVMAQAPDKAAARKSIEDYFRKTAQDNNSKLPNTETPNQWMLKQGVNPEKAVLVCFQKSAGDLVLLLSLGKSLREQYPDKQLVISCEPQYKELIDGNPYFDLVIPWQEWFRNQLLLQGQGGSKPMVYKALLPFVGTQHVFDFVGADNINLELNYAN